MFKKLLFSMLCCAAVTCAAAEDGKDYMDVFPKRQVNHSWRTIELPEKADPGALSLFELEGDKLTDKAVPFRVFKDGSGRNIVKFKVPGLRHGYGGGVIWKDGKATPAGVRNPVSVPEDFACRLLFRKGGVIDNTIPAGDAELIYNGNFTLPDAKHPNYPEGYYGVFANDERSGRKHFSFTKPGLRFIRKKKGWDCFTIPVRLERGVRYTFSSKFSCTNPGGNWIVVSLGFNDEKGKSLPSGTSIYLAHDRKALPLKERTKSFVAPKGAVAATLFFRVYALDQVMDVQSISLKAEPFRSGKMDETELLRKELVSTYVPGLSLTENLSSAVVTPHWDLFPNPAQKLPKLLYLTGNTGSFITRHVHRRHIIELAQRGKLEFTYLPLFRKIGSAITGWHFNWANDLEAYTLAKLKAITQAPAMVMLDTVDFVYIPQVTRDQLLSWQKQGTPMIFFNCANIPKELQGKAAALPPHLLATLPRMREVRPSYIQSNFRFAKQGKTPIFIFRTGNFTSWDVRYLPFVPKEFAYELVPNPKGYDFPYPEYYYLLQFKALRHAAGAEGKVIARKANGTALELEAAEPCTVTLITSAIDYYGRPIGKAEKKFSLQKGKNQLALPLPAAPLPGGVSVLNFKVCDAQGRELDCGASRIDTPALPLKINMSSPDLIFARRKPVSFTLDSAPGAVFSCEIADTDGRIVWQGGGTGTKFAAPLHFPYSKLYHLFVKAELNGRSALLKQEFSLESAPIDPFDTSAVIWCGQPQFYPILRKMGFTMTYTNFSNDIVKNGALRAIASNMLAPVPFGSGAVLNRTQRVYRGNVATDPVRNPCFSDPDRKKKVEAEIRRIVKDYRFRYFGARYNSVADEADLGGTVCYSPHCLAAFRKELKTRYKDLNELNKSWDTSFTSWDQVVPVQLKEIRNKERLARYVEHKLFMNKVFARDWVGAVGAAYRKEVPDAISGLSGTGNPGYSYDWVQMMKYNPLLSYYGGPQGNAVRDFGPPGAIRGQWLGYTRGFLRNEVSVKGRIWRDTFLGANLICKFPCESLLGDLTLTPNAEFFGEAVREIRSGFGARLLRGRELGREVGILYSQLSVLCALSNQVGSQNITNIWSSWPALLNDLGLRGRMISYEELEEKVPEFKVVILPGSFSLSRKQLINLKKFAERGGTVIADCGPGWYDGHGNRAQDKLAEEFFGIDRSSARFYPADAPVYKTLPVGETGLKLKGSASGITEHGEPLMITKKHGKGKSVLLNLAIGNYYSVTLGGVGGEEEIAKGGSNVTREAFRSLAEPLIREKCRIPFEVTGIAGPTLLFRRDGENYYAGLLPNYGDEPLYSSLKRTDARLKFPVAGHLYEMRSGKYLGHGSVCQLKVRGGDPVLISILPERIAGIDAALPGSWKRGESRKVSLKVRGGRGNHVFRIEIRDPEGVLPEGYAWNIYAPAADCSFDFQFACNDMPGKWLIRVRDVDSGVTREFPVDLK